MMHSSCKILTFCFWVAIALIPAQAQSRVASQPAITIEAVTSSQPRR